MTHYPRPVAVGVAMALGLPLPPTLELLPTGKRVYSLLPVAVPL